MKQISDIWHKDKYTLTLCYRCLGCERLAIEAFRGVRECEAYREAADAAESEVEKDAKLSNDK